MGRVIGLLVSVLPASQFGCIHYRQLERAKILALSDLHDYNVKCRWPKKCLEDLKWWRDSPQGWKCSFDSVIPTTTLITDAALEGWGAIWNGEEIFGPWESDEESRIDELELLAVLFAIQCWGSELCAGDVIQLWCDNQVLAVAYIKNMGGGVERLDCIAREIWLELESRDVFMIASYINTKENPADALTQGIRNKKQLLDCEVQLNPTTFQWSVNQGPFKRSVDWFASSVNNQLPPFYSWNADPAAEGVDVFCFDWGLCDGYIFPPFVLIPRVLRKMIEGRARVILIHPDWPGALWAPDLRRWFPASADLLRYPNQPGLQHPMKDL